VERDGDELWVLDVDATEDEVERGLGGTVRADGPGDVLGAGDGGHAGGDDRELGLLGGLQQGKNGLEQPDGTVEVDIDVLGHVGRLDLGDLDESLGFKDTGIRDHNIEVGDALVLDGRDGVCGVALGGAVDLNEDELAGIGLADVGEMLSVFAIRIASSSHDGGVWPGEVLFDEATSKALWMDAWSENVDFVSPELLALLAPVMSTVVVMTREMSSVKIRGRRRCVGAECIERCRG